MRAGKPFRLFRSVRFRIAASTSLAVGVLAIAALFGLRESIRWTLRHEIDQVLIEDASEVGLVLKELGPRGVKPVADELRRKATGHVQHRWFVKLSAEGGEIIWESDLSPAAIAKESKQTASRPTTVDNYRLYHATAPANELGVVDFEIGSSLTPMRKDLARIDRLVTVASLLMLLLSPLIGYALAGLVIREVATLTAKAASLQPTRLEDRLPETGSGDEFDQLAITVNGLLDRIADFIQEKRDFLANAAHELRTPIAAIRSSVEVALASDRSSDEYRELLEQLIEDSESLEVLVNQVLLLSEAAASQDTTSLETVMLSDVVGKAIEMFRGVAETRQIELRSNIQPNVTTSGVRRHLSQVINNLLDNALKYTPEGGQVEIELLVDQTHHTILTVTDSGIGIAGNEVPKVFDRFFRSDQARSRESTRGAGLGLSICKSIVEAHGGQIVCKSKLAQGTRFVVSLPPCPAQSLQQ